jgi:predicted nucleic acid-binding OB-fold protein
MKHRNFIFAFIVATILIILGCASTPLIKASAKGDSSAVQKLIKEGANINEQDSGGATPLYYAVSTRNYNLVKMLIDKGANVNVGDKRKITPLMLSASYGSTDIVELLIESGADINAKDYSDETPLLYATGAIDFNISKLLIDKGANINAQNKMGLTALHYTAQTYNDNNAVLIAEYLLNKNAATNLKDANGWTALRHAIYLKNIDVVAAIRKQTNWAEEIESLSTDEALRSPSYYKPEQDMFHVPVGKERAYKIAVTDCNLIVIPNKTGLLIGTGGVGYGVGLIVDAVTIKGKFQNCMAKMGFECKNSCSK